MEDNCGIEIEELILNITWWLMVMVIDIGKSIEDWMENGNIIHDNCRWLTINDIDGDCPLLTVEMCQ